MRQKLLFLNTMLFFLLLIFSPSLVFGQNRIGVGVATGKMEIDENLLLGKRYNLPPLVVLNTGEVSSYYEVVVEYKADHPNMKPPKNWFKFTPEKFFLEPGGQEAVQIRLTMPISGAKPGDYYALMVAQTTDAPVEVEETDTEVETDDVEEEPKNPSAGATVGVAAGSSLYFTVEPANFLQGLYYRLLDLYNEHYPCSAIGLILLVLILIWMYIKRNFEIEKKDKNKKGKSKSKKKTKEKRIDEKKSLIGKSIRF